MRCFSHLVLECIDGRFCLGDQNCRFNLFGRCLLCDRHVFFVNRVSNRLVIYARADALCQVFPFSCLLTLVRASTRTGRLRGASRAPRGMVAAILVPMDRIANARGTVAFVTRRRVFPATNVSRYRVPTAVTRFAFHIEAFCRVSIAVCRKRFHVKGYPTCASTLKCYVFDEGVNRTNDAFELTMDDCPTFTDVATVFDGLRVRLTERLATALDGRERVERVRARRARRVRGFGTMKRSYGANNPLFLRRAPRDLIHRTLINCRCDNARV